MTETKLSVKDAARDAIENIDIPLWGYAGGLKGDVELADEVRGELMDAIDNIDGDNYDPKLIAAAVAAAEELERVMSEVEDLAENACSLIASALHDVTEATEEINLYEREGE